MPLLTIKRNLLALVALLAAPSVYSEATETHGSWTVRCDAVEASTERKCIMFQNLVLKTGGQTVLQFSVGLDPADRTPTVILSLPLGISLPPGVAIRIDEGKPAKFPVERCEPDGCRAGIKLRPATVEQLGAGKQLSITFFDGGRQPIKVPLSLEGFNSAYKALSGS